MRLATLQWLRTCKRQSATSLTRCLPLALFISGTVNVFVGHKGSEKEEDLYKGEAVH